MTDWVAILSALPIPEGGWNARRRSVLPERDFGNDDRAQLLTLLRSWFETLPPEPELMACDHELEGNRWHVHAWRLLAERDAAELPSFWLELMRSRASLGCRLLYGDSLSLLRRFGLRLLPDLLQLLGNPRTPPQWRGLLCTSLGSLGRHHGEIRTEVISAIEAVLATTPVADVPLRMSAQEALVQLGAAQTAEAAYRKR